MPRGERLFLSASPPPPHVQSPPVERGGAPPGATTTGGAVLRPAAILGVPLDRTASYRAGTAGGPDGVREASWSLETFSPLLGRDLVDIPLHDFGNLALDTGATLEETLAGIELAVVELRGRGFFPLLIGGEHLVTLPAYRAVLAACAVGGGPPVCLHYDAHADLRDDYEGLRLSHATVIRRVCEVAGAANVYQVGVRSGTKEEILWGAANVHHIPGPLVGATRRVLQAVAGRSLYLSLDIDVLDPAHAPGTGNPEPGGPSAREMFEVVSCIGAAASLGARAGGIDLLGFDLVEVSPALDPSGRTPVVAAKIIRELLIARGA